MDSIAATNKQNNLIESYARIGMAAKGVVFTLLGGLTLAAALGIGGQTSDRKEVLQTIIQQPFGKILLAVVAFGLLGYAIWRFVQAIKDPENKGDDAKGIIARIGFMASGVIYAIFTYYAASMVFGSGGGSGGSSGSGNSNQFIANKLLEQSFGQWLVGIVGAIVLIKGLRQIYKGFAEKYKEDIQDAHVEEKVKKTYNSLGKIGYISRGVVFGIIGYFFFIAAIQSNPGAAKGTEGVFRFLSSTGGPWLLAVIALGLLGYGIFMFVKSKYKQIGNI